MSPHHRTQLRELVLEHLPLLALVGLYVLIGQGVERWLGQPGAVTLRAEHSSINLVATLAFLFSLAGYVLWLLPQVPREVSAFRYVAQHLPWHWFTLRRVGGFLIVHLTLPFFTSTFGSLKRLIPHIQPFAWDERFWRIDRALHGGVDPWRLLQPLLGSPEATLFINVLYNAWMIVMLLTILWQACSGRRRARAQFFVTMLLMWMIPGTLMATALSSVGPCFYGKVVPGPDPFADQLAWLANIHTQHYTLWAVEVQDMLWQSYSTDTVQTVSGISAMPSLHVASSVLMALAGWQAGRRLGWAYTVFLAFIQVGSVHLAWHYAIDGYVGGVVTFALWHAVGWTMRRVGWCPADEPPPPS